MRTLKVKLTPMRPTGVHIKKTISKVLLEFHTKQLKPMTSNLPDGEGLQIRPASFNDIPFIQDIANKTWPVAYGSILSQKQLDYMLEMIYSTAALQKQMHDNQHFFLALQNFIPVGFAAFSPIDDATHKLHKLYVLPGIQKMGAGKKLLQTIETTAKSMGATRLQLNVNRLNNALTFYKANGFEIIEEKDIEIGQGFYMNDYIMEKQL